MKILNKGQKKSHRTGGFKTGLFCSSDWTRTSDPLINSQML